MDPENRHSTSKADWTLLGRGCSAQPFRFLALLGMMHGIVVATVLSTNPTAITVVKYGIPVFAIVGLVAGVRHGFFFNISNHCTGGQRLWGIIGGLGAAVVGVLALSLAMVIVGVVAGFAAGWIVGSFLSSRRRGATPWLGAGVGAVVQAGWTDPATAIHAVALGGAVGAIAGPAFLLMCFGLGYAMLHKIKPPRSPFDRRKKGRGSSASV